MNALQDHQIDVVQFFTNSSRFKILLSDYLDQTLSVSRGQIDQMIRNPGRVKNLNIREF